MTRVELESTVGADGVLALAIPLGASEANHQVKVVVESLAKETKPEAWLQFIQETAGSISDPTFKRQPQGDYEKREALD